MDIPIRILIIEDSPDDAQLMVRTLEHGGYAVTWQLVDRRDAMQKVLNKPRWDLVLSDHSMPGFSSTEALQLLREAGHDTPFILVSGMSDEDAAALMKQIRADDCVLKSEADELLLPIVRRQLREAEKRRKRGEGRG